MSKMSQEALTNYQTMAIITQFWHRAKFYFTSISISWYLIMVPNMKKIHHGRMCEDGFTFKLTDRLTDGQMD